jgi:hypothetical protein
MMTSWQILGMAAGGFFVFLVTTHCVALVRKGPWYVRGAALAWYGLVGIVGLALLVKKGSAAFEVGAVLTGLAAGAFVGARGLAQQPDEWPIVAEKASRDSLGAALSWAVIATPLLWSRATLAPSASWACMYAIFVGFAFVFVVLAAGADVTALGTDEGALIPLLFTFAAPFTGYLLAVMVGSPWMSREHTVGILLSFAVAVLLSGLWTQARSEAMHLEIGKRVAPALYALGAACALGVCLAEWYGARMSREAILYGGFVCAVAPFVAGLVPFAFVAHCKRPGAFGCKTGNAEQCRDVHERGPGG